ncbi:MULTISPECIES: ADP-ribosyltransferase [Streptomyces]|uniref:Guanine-specific ADP-ribosyl transferase n=2 Tax=Streptomyces coelicolor (strain ATCC BAA-471 / A3(2) / M145) TaxID=100226 RepID=SCARP_STRCO|nr:MULTISPECIES: ADP-ribosyltransferase [Streptomyces]Q9L1E4.1 RecName: Full=Guanine-specific ADP-ribosyl transferase; AltName: Full=NAD(+):guanine-N2-ADP-D-ribosyltransferase; AltName: Full=S.coelicolor ADP-ribosylating protein; Short=ScARP; Flags: Precursor [Streptomyces coelicolor A3(2)]MDX2928566.1 ADP-ribosyltransferase [Streptomyces sp. NRRL_B-16638]MDX3349909.1 ADP-ribosyltransferase [Streptomyces sp. ME02-6979A]MYU44981.1 ADP-ribosyltransferase [Streptomyces sp. SID7813]NSL83351.1 ADP-
MITTSLRRRTAAAVLSLSAVLATTAATAPGAAPAPSAAPAKAAPACPQFDDRTKAAADRGVDVDRITPEPVWRTTCGTLYRSDSRGPQVVFEEGFHAKDVQNGQYDVEKYVLVNQPSPYVSTSYDHDLYKTWYKSGYNYYVDAPGGIDVNKTIGDTHKWADQVEVAFPGGIQRKYIIGVCPVDRQTKTEIMSDCESNPHYQPWH